MYPKIIYFKEEYLCQMKTIFTKQQHLISPKNDVVFQILFGEVGSEKYH